MVVLIVFLTLLLLPVQRFRRADLEPGLRWRVLAIREGAALAAIASTLLWQGWCRHDPAGTGVELLVTAALLGGIYAAGEAAVRTSLRRNGFEPTEGPRGPLY